jgi:methionyl-tRNA formyltransferase
MSKKQQLIVILQTTNIHILHQNLQSLKTHQSPNIKNPKNHPQYKKKKIQTFTLLLKHKQNPDLKIHNQIKTFNFFPKKQNLYPKQNQ